jgi:hypothetical protein
MSQTYGRIGDTKVFKYKSSNGMRLQMVPENGLFSTFNKKEAKKLADLLYTWVYGIKGDYE